jgi:hypothetical protein
MILAAIRPLMNGATSSRNVCTTLRRWFFGPANDRPGPPARPSPAFWLAPGSPTLRHDGCIGLSCGGGYLAGEETGDDQFLKITGRRGSKPTTLACRCWRRRTLGCLTDHGAGDQARADHPCSISWSSFAINCNAGAESEPAVSVPRQLGRYVAE